MNHAGHSWEDYLRERFPGYLLPESAATSLSAAEARRFLEGLSGRQDMLDVLRGASLLARRASELRSFVNGLLLDLVRNLPSRTERVRREWEGGFQGRLAIAETLDRHMMGRRTAFVTQSPRRVFELPENVLVRGVCERLLGLLALLRNAKALPDGGWAAGLRDCEGTLRRVVSATPLREVSPRPLTIGDENAARAARHAAYHHAAHWAAWLREALDEDDPERIARVVAEGALLPLADSTRFEVAAGLRFAEALATALDERSPGWRIERSLVLPGRRELLAFSHENGTVLRLFYNQVVLPAGAADLSGLHYLGNTGRLRPDLTITLHNGPALVGAAVVECKLSTDPGYILSGLHEAMLYRWEYAPHLFAWPKALLVASGPVPGDVREGDDVIASAWERWPPHAAVRAIVEHAVRASERAPLDERAPLS